MKTLRCYECKGLYESKTARTCYIDKQFRCKSCRDRVNEKRRDPIKRKASGKASRIRNIEKIRERDRLRSPGKSLKYNTKRRAEDIGYKLRTNLRSRLNMAIKIGQKSGSAVNDLGCTVEKLKQHLENLFYINKKDGRWMSWECYGHKGWHIDHIIPLSKLDLTDKEQFLKACHYTNLQPLWAFDNFSKGDK